MITAGLLLAAGHSRRFGPSNKLLADLGGRPLVTHAATALRDTGVDHLLAAARDADVADLLTGFDVVAPAGEEAPQSASLRAGITRAEALGSDRVLVVLGDMPRVGPSLMRAVLAQADATGAAAATDGTRRAPPACWPRTSFAALSALEGDRGAGPLLRALPEDALVRTTPDRLADVDLPEDLRALEALRADEARD